MIFKIKKYSFLLAIFINVFLFSCSNKTILQGEILMSSLIYTIPQDCDFNVITNANNYENVCTPKLKSAFFSPFSGVLINGPSHVEWPSNIDPNDFPTGPWGETDGPLRLMVAGLVRLPYKTLNLKGEFSEEILLVAVNVKTAQAYSGKMPKPELLPEPDFFDDLSERSRSEEDKNTLLSDYFNFDLVHDLGLPIEDATYHVYSTLGEYKSNVLTIQTSVTK